MMTKKKADWRIVITAIVALMILEIYALSQGINGTMLSAVLVVIAGLAGWSLPQLETK